MFKLLPVSLEISMSQTVRLLSFFYKVQYWKISSSLVADS